ncbi:Myb/SANT-like DNA-binding domain 4 [Dillenia turbinata]|uniref:Myb/SANT-like DNA-binding domain 4 n=1 Tax=Dillenia turbinata TaxID=194707 RepID=A0AAN8V7U3_9MAGN
MLGNSSPGGEEKKESGGDIVGLISKEEERDRNNSSTGNRWPREETLALLKIRSEMDVAFRDSSLKAPLWDDVSRKLSELGYNRSAKKCKEKFENISKYHKRTKDCRSSKQNGKAYRFFEQLEALDHQAIPSSSAEFNQISTQPARTTMLTTQPMPTRTTPNDPTNVVQEAVPITIHNPIAEFMSTTSTSTASSSGKDRKSSTNKKKRKMGEFFERLMNEVVEKQEKLQKKFLEALEKCENDRIAREEAWRLQELARIKREHELLVQERSVAAAKDAAVIAFLQKIAENSNSFQLPENLFQPEKSVEKQQETNSGEIVIHSSSSRWPKAEVEALIKLRTNYDVQYQENGPKGPLWEEISSSMKKLGYDRSAKRCKEKWENINKYFRRVKESKKRRLQDSKTCPYFHQLDALYKEKTKRIDNSDNSGNNLKPEELLMQMMEVSQRQQTNTEERGSENIEDRVQGEEDEDGEDENEDEGNAYEIVANNPSSMTIME